MGSQKFINPDNEKQSVEIEECKLDKKLKDIFTSFLYNRIISQ